MCGLPNWSKPRYLKAETLEVPKKVRVGLVWSLLSEIQILVYSSTECSTSNIYLYFEEKVTIFPYELKTWN